MEHKRGKNKKTYKGDSPKTKDWENNALDKILEGQAGRHPRVQVYQIHEAFEKSSLMGQNQHHVSKTLVHLGRITHHTRCATIAGQKLKPQQILNT